MVKISKFSPAVASLLRSRVGSYEPHRFSGITSFYHLERFNIIPDDVVELSLRPGHEERAAMTSILGKDKFWSSTNLYRHLEVLQSLVPRHLNEDGVRPWTDAFFFRTSAMVSSNKRMVLSLEQVVRRTAIRPSSTTRLSGFIDHAAIIADKNLAETFFLSPSFGDLINLIPCGFFVAEAKEKSLSLKEHLPQVVGEMYACAKDLKRDILRGALTDGHEWIFIIIVLNHDGNGAKYRWTTSIEFIEWGMPSQIVKPWPDVLAGILLHWIENSFADIGNDDWFESSKRLVIVPGLFRPF